MSVLVRFFDNNNNDYSNDNVVDDDDDESNKTMMIRLLVKGADSSILPLLNRSKDELGNAINSLNHFASNG